MTTSKRKPAVLFISHDASRTGAPLCLHEFLDSITREGATFSPYLFVTEDGPLLPEWRKRGIGVVKTTKRVRGSVAVRLLSLLRSTVTYIRLLQEVKPQLIYSNTIRNGLEVVVARVLGIRTLVHVHEGENIMRQYARSLRVASLFTSSFVCASKYSARSLEKVTGRKAVVVSNGIRTESSDSSARQSAAESVLTLGMVGGIQSNKGQHVVIDALAILLFERKIPVRLRIYGEVEDVEYRQRIGKQIDGMKLGQFVEFCGSSADLSEIYGHLDILVVASFDEAFSRVILEAFAYVKPVVASSVGAVPEIIRDNENGLLVPSGDASTLAEAIVRLALDPALVRRITSAALHDVRERFRLKDTVARLREQVEAALT